ncbi:MAG: VanZ family protein [Planctomycetaceae bacterium]
MVQGLQENLVRRLRPWLSLIVAVYWLLMFVATHIPNPSGLMPPGLSDKVLHAVAFFVLYVLLSLRQRCLDQQWPDPQRHRILLVLTVGYAACDELLQALPLIGRQADWRDWAADCAGLLLAAILVDWLRRRSHSASTLTG